MPPNGFILKTSYFSVEWCGCSHLLPYGLTHQASFQQWLATTGFFRSYTLYNKVICKRKYYVR